MLEHRKEFIERRVENSVVHKEGGTSMRGRSRWVWDPPSPEGGRRGPGGSQGGRGGHGGQGILSMGWSGGEAGARCFGMVQPGGGGVMCA